jgi:hypothetical protein
MSKTVSLAAYILKIRNVQERKNVPLSSCPGDVDFFEFMHDFLKPHKDHPLDEKQSQQVFRLEKLEKNDDERYLYGILETGEYGTDSVLWDTKSKKESHKRTRTEAEMLPFYFLAYIPDGPDLGIVLFQRSGNYGIRKMFGNMLNTYFAKQFPEHKVFLNPVVDEESFKKYTNGKIESVRFIRYTIPKDLADLVGTGSNQKTGRVELVVYAAKGERLPVNSRLLSFLSKKKKIEEFIELDETNFAYQNVKLTSKVAGVRRTLDINNPKHLRAYYDISATVNWDDGRNRPAFASIHEIALELAADIRTSALPMVKKQ